MSSVRKLWSVQETKISNSFFSLISLIFKAEIAKLDYIHGSGVINPAFNYVFSILPIKGEPCKQNVEKKGIKGDEAAGKETWNDNKQDKVPKIEKDRVAKSGIHNGRAKVLMGTCWHNGIHAHGVKKKQKLKRKKTKRREKGIRIISQYDVASSSLTAYNAPRRVTDFRCVICTSLSCSYLGSDLFHK